MNRQTSRRGGLSSERPRPQTSGVAVAMHLYLFLTNSPRPQRTNPTQQRHSPAQGLNWRGTSERFQPPLVAHVITDCPAGSRGAVPRPFARGREYGGPAVSDHRHAGALEQPSGRRGERQSAQISRTRRDNSEKSCVAWYQGESQNTEAPRTDAGVPLRLGFISHLYHLGRLAPAE